MAAAVAGAALGAVGKVIGGAIQAGTDRANVKDTLQNNLELQRMRGQNSLDVQNLVNTGLSNVEMLRGGNSLKVQSSINTGLRDVKQIEGFNASNVEQLRGLNTLSLQTAINRGLVDVEAKKGQNSNQLQRNQFDYYTQQRQLLAAQLEKSGLPAYLATMQPDESFMQIRPVRGLNFAMYYPGQRRPRLGA